MIIMSTLFEDNLLCSHQSIRSLDTTRSCIYMLTRITQEMLRGLFSAESEERKTQGVDHERSACHKISKGNHVTKDQGNEEPIKRSEKKDVKNPLNLPQAAKGS